MPLEKKVLVHDELGRGFARAILVGEIIYVSGVTGRLDLKTWQEIPEAKGDIRFQARQTFEWLKMVLLRCGSSLEKVFKLNIFLLNFDELPQVLEIYREYFANNTPAVNAVGVSRLVGIAELEVDAEALV